jgi:DNA-binding NtrC family response regulator
MQTILLADDKKGMCDVVARVLEHYGLSTVSVHEGEKCLDSIRRHSPDAVILDKCFPTMSGREILPEIRRQFPSLPVIILTGYADIEEAVEFLDMGAFDYIDKAEGFGRLLRSLFRALDAGPLPDIAAPPAASRLNQDALQGKSALMQEVIGNIERAAANDLSVIIQGESGTGKELAARMIHDRSVRREGNFVAVNCSAIPENLAESELFGHCRGAFSGATETKIGKIEHADGGTLLLDEIALLPVSIQGKLLRTVEGKTVTRLGENRERSVDVRIIASTNIPLTLAVERGQFRRDLFYRLSELLIVMPPLRERREDIPLLAGIFLYEARRLCRKDIAGFEDEALDALMNGRWRGNVRELKNVVRKAVLAEESDRLTIAAVLRALEDGVPYDLKSTRLKAIIDEQERESILDAMQSTSGCVRRASSLLGIDRKTLYRKRKKHNLP